MHRRTLFAYLICFSLITAACGDDGSTGDDDPLVTLEHCTFADVEPTAGSGGTVETGALTAGTAEAFLSMPVGSALGSYTSRAGFLGSTGTVDLRKVPVSGNFNPSIGVQTAPRVKVLVLTAGGETVALVKLDLGFGYEGLVYDLEARLGPQYAGKVMITASHSHSSWGHYTAHSAYQMGAGVMRDLIYKRLLDDMENAINAALAARQPAKIGFFADLNFDPDDNITRDRRGENDELMGGPRKDDAFFMIRVDAADDTPLAILPVYGVHGTLMDDDNSFASTDAPGGMERRLEEEFDSPVLVMHLQGAGGDVSPKPRGRLNCDIKPGNEDDPCFDWLRIDAHGRATVDTMMTAWTAAGSNMQSSLAIEMLTRSVELGPTHDTFTIRDGALTYAKFDPEVLPDRVIFTSTGEVQSPIDEFNAPVGAGLCETDEISFGASVINGVEDLEPYGSCAQVGPMIDIFEILLDTEMAADPTHPICQSTRTNLSALRLGDYVIGTLPGEVTVMLADLIRDGSPVAPDKTIILGYAQGQTGYLLTPEDWLSAGYEASINLWGPLEGEYLAEQLVALMPLATSSDREDASTGGSNRFVTPSVTDTMPVDDPAPSAGTIPATVPERVWTRTGPAASAQPEATIKRISGIARFVWIGDDPLVATPVVTLERETSTDVWETVRRRSGRTVRDGDVLISYTPQPLRRDGNNPQTYYWVTEWQAVPWLGSGSALDALTSVGGVPLGRYRYNVVGKDWTLTSDPFTVTPADVGVVASQAGTTLDLTLTVQAARGFRLLDMDLASNGPVPVRNTAVNIVVTQSAGGDLNLSGTTDADGKVSVDVGGATAVSVTVTTDDTFNNVGSATLP